MNHSTRITVHANDAKIMPRLGNICTFTMLMLEYMFLLLMLSVLACIVLKNNASTPSTYTVASSNALELVGASYFRHGYIIIIIDVVMIKKNTQSALEHTIIAQFTSY